MPDIIDAVKSGKFLFADVTDETARKAQTLHEINQRLLHELRAFSEYLEEERRFFSIISGHKRDMLNQETIKEFRTRAYRLDSNIDQMRKRVHSNSKLAAILDHIKRATESLKSQGIATEAADHIIDRQLRPSLTDAIKTLDATTKGILSVAKEEDEILRETLQLRRIL